jgi:hypothetical protein
VVTLALLGVTSLVWPLAAADLSAFLYPFANQRFL